MAETLVDLRRANLVERILLRGLARDDVIAMVSGTLLSDGSRRRVGAAPCGRRPRQSLFLREILRHLAETGATILSDEGRWVATRRIEQLRHSGGCQGSHRPPPDPLVDDVNTALRAGSVLGREFGLDVLEKVTDLGTDALLDALDEATARASSKRSRV